MKNNFLLGFLLGLTFLVLMGAFTRDWTESTPTDATVANQIDDYNRYLRVDTSDRLENMFYGFIAGENTLSQHCQYLQFYEQASITQPSAGYGRLGCKAVSGKCELHWHDEDGDEIQLTNGGNFGGCNFELVAGKDLLGSSTSDITINTNKFTVAGATGNTVVAGTLGVTGVATLGKGSLLASSDAPTTDAMIANKKYVVDQIATLVGDDPTANDSESNALALSHAYLTQTAGFVTMRGAVSNSSTFYGYVGTTTDPAGAGTQVAGTKTVTGGIPSMCFFVGNGKYFELVGGGTVYIYWTPLVSGGAAPVDQD